MPAYVTVKISSHGTSPRASKTETVSTKWLKGILLPDFIPPGPHVVTASVDLGNESVNKGIGDRSVSKSPRIPSISSNAGSILESSMAMSITMRQSCEPILHAPATSPAQVKRSDTSLSPDSLEMTGSSEVSPPSKSLPTCPSPFTSSPSAESSKGMARIDTVTPCKME